MSVLTPVIIGNPQTPLSHFQKQLSFGKPNIAQQFLNFGYVGRIQAAGLQNKKQGYWIFSTPVVIYIGFKYKHRPKPLVGCIFLPLPKVKFSFMMLRNGVKSSSSSCDSPFGSSAKLQPTPLPPFLNICKRVKCFVRCRVLTVSHCNFLHNCRHFNAKNKALDCLNKQE